MTIHNNHPMRRSARIERKISVFVTSLDPNPSRRICEECHTVTINAHGCGVIASERVPAGTHVLLDLLAEPRQARGVVIDAVPLDNSGTSWLIGIELATFGNFWGIVDPPSDWAAQAQLQSSAVPLNRSNAPISTPAPAPVSAYPARLTDLSPTACYLEIQETFPVDSILEIEFHTDEMRVRCFAAVRLVHRNTGMGLELTPSESDQQGALHLLLDLLLKSGKGARLETLVYEPSAAPQQARNPHAQVNFAPDDCLLALILNPDSLNREQFLRALRRQRSQSLKK